MASTTLSHAQGRGSSHIDIPIHTQQKKAGDGARARGALFELTQGRAGSEQAAADKQPLPERTTRRVERWLAEQQSLGDEGSANTRRRHHVTRARSTQHLSLSKRTRKNSLSEIEGGSESLCSGSFVIVEEDESRDPNTPLNIDALFHRLKLDTDCPPDHAEIRPNPFRTVQRTLSSPRSLRSMNMLAASAWRNLAFNMSHSPKHAQTTLLPELTVDLTTPTATIKDTVPAHQRSALPESFVEKELLSPPVSSEDFRPRKLLRRRLSNITKSPTGPISRSQGSNSPRTSTSTSISNTTNATTATAVDSVMRVEAGDGAKTRFLPKFALTLSKPILRASTADVVSPVSSGSTLSPMPRNSDEGHLTVPGLDGPTSRGGLTPTSSVSSLCRKPSQSSIVFRDKKHNASSSALSTLSVASMGSTVKGMGGWTHHFHRPSSSKKKRLVVGGISRDDVEAVEGLRRWCERFGEVQQMTRVANGDLHVDFKRGDVADTVCRVFARVYINGVGSVHLSWISGKKR